jgi:hypothetical protein
VKDVSLSARIVIACFFHHTASVFVRRKTATCARAHLEAGRSVFDDVIIITCTDITIVTAVCSCITAQLLITKIAVTLAGSRIAKTTFKVDFQHIAFTACLLVTLRPQLTASIQINLLLASGVLAQLLRGARIAGVVIGRITVSK